MGRDTSSRKDFRYGVVNAWGNWKSSSNTCARAAWGHWTREGEFAKRGKRGGLRRRGSGLKNLRNDQGGSGPSLGRKSGGMVYSGGWEN